MTYRLRPMLESDGEQIVPIESGLFAGDPATGSVRVFYPGRNAAASSRVDTVDPRDHPAAARDVASAAPGSGATTRARSRHTSTTC